MSEQWVTVCKTSDLIADAGICALLNDQQVAIFQESDSVYAISNYDPIGEANVLSRGIIGSLEGKLVVASPLYKQHFCLQSGQCLEDENVSIPTFDVRVEADQVQLKA